MLVIVTFYGGLVWGWVCEGFGVVVTDVLMFWLCFAICLLIVL